MVLPLVSGIKLAVKMAMIPLRPANIQYVEGMPGKSWISLFSLDIPTRIKDYKSRDFFSLDAQESRITHRMRIRRWGST